MADDLADVGAPARIFDLAAAGLGPVSALVLCHCESVDSGLLEGWINGQLLHSDGGLHT